jgi:hypothetical protein
MPNVTSVVLSLQHGGALNPAATRTATVSFTISFNSIEILAGIVFKADASLRSVDPGAIGTETLTIGSAIIKAASGPFSTTLTRVLTRANLNEDPDVRFVGNPANLHIIEIEDRDEWLATVKISPIVFGTDTMNSAQVSGSWGREGSS